MKNTNHKIRLLFLIGLITAFGFSPLNSLRADAAESDFAAMYDEMVYWGDSAAYLYYFAETSGYQPESVLYYYCEKDAQEDLVKAEFEKMALYALLANFPEKDALRYEETEYVYVTKDVMDTAARELYGIDMEAALSYCTFFTLSDGEYVFLQKDFGTVEPQSAAHALYEDSMSGFLCLSESGTWVEPYEFDMYFEPIEDGTYSNYRFSYMILRVPDETISTSRAEEEMISNRLMAFLYKEPANAFLAADFTGTEQADGSIIYECGGKKLTAEELAASLCPNGNETERNRVELGYIFKNGDHYIADYGEGLLEVKLTEDKKLLFLRNRRYRK